ncbi:MAG: Butyryl-CoA dehydrogenase [Thermomicrobiales bacterium]|jgi:alkylation response protein AidB-like acyl-CoA dehydrogenase|nr:Butyryl-CoA dehydrogenase [Thermomicrobiales bacterium]
MVVADRTRTEIPSGWRPRPVHPGDDEFVPMAAELGAEFAPRAAEHDRENTFVSENFERMRETGYLRLAVPRELGGLGASMRQVCFAQAELARACAATALAVNMHQYLVLANVFRWKKGAPGAENVLRRVADDGIVLMTSGGSDGIWPSGKAVKENGGYRISGRKVFCSQAPVASVLTTMAVYDDPAEGPVVLLAGIPMSAEGITILDNWDTMGMRATGSNDVLLEDVKIAEAQVAARRPWGKVDPALRTAGVHFAPPVAAVYAGIAAAARDEAVRVIGSRARGDGNTLADDPTVQRAVGLMDAKLRTMWWALLGALDELGEEYAPDDRALEAVMIAKRHVVTEAQEVVDLAMQTVGGSAYFKTSPLERAYRDIRAGLFHPMNPERTLQYAGRLALGVPADTVW